MKDPRVTRLAELLCNHSTDLSSSDSVLIHAIDIPDQVTAELVRVALATGAKVHTKIESTQVQRALLRAQSSENMAQQAEIDLHEMKKMTAYIALRGSENAMELADVPMSQRENWQKLHGTPVHLEQRVPKTKWVVLRWPLPSMAQMASLSTEAFEDFYFDVCTIDYSKMQKAALPLVELMNQTDQVHLKGPGTDLTFSIKGIGSKSCHGTRNIPDGECFSCPVRESVNGTVQYNTVSLYQSIEFKNIRFVVKDGKIIEATCEGNSEKLNQILDTDEGARYFGEWSLGYNPTVLHPMKDTLFDEKISGSFHLTPGNAYEGPGGNGNKSAIHWDIVCIQRADYGGGEVWFDGRLIRKDGIFVVPELEGLNPEHLGGDGRRG
ncbi:MAG: aminopeptidase [Fimbriimonadaceae bacterium]|jgi:aminopeptidase|nr:aminopeptidase [Fimbriimonadaceae bacterium]